MSDLSAWQQRNDDYLSAALHWLRLRLVRLAQRSQPSATVLPASSPQPSETPAPKKGLFRWCSGEKERLPAPETMLLPKADDTVTDAHIAQAAEVMAAAAATETPPALVLLSHRFGLSRFEQEILLLCAAMEFDTRIGALCARAQGDSLRGYPTFALALALFDEPVWEALSPERPLRYWQLLEINQPGAQPLTTSALRADERIVNYLKGLNYLDDRLTPLLAPLADEPEELPPSQQERVETITRHLRAAPRHLPLVQLLGADSSSKRLIAARAASELGLGLYRLAAEMLPAQWAELEKLARLWQRESLLLPVALYLDAHDGERELPSLNQFVARSGGVLFLDTREPRLDLGRDALSVDVAKPTATEQRAAWTAALGEAAGDSPQALANQFNLGQAEIQRIARTTLAAHQGRAACEQLWEACLSASRPRLDTLAQRLEPKAAWDDLVLPPAESELLQQIGAQVQQRGTVYETWGFARRMNRGLGISALFAGESGTGKTMAAEVIANALRLSLYRIDLSAVVSKYIGETEKNLRRVFDAAEDGGAILFFDEADALFGKRSEVKDSHDRYANIEINYLLQRMEAYRGLAILATNMKSALDQAFMRRLQFIVKFPFPGPKERKLIWRKVFPPETPTEGLDYEQLSRLNLTGGSIHNIALNAAFMAARAGTAVTLPLVLEAARGEFRKLEKPINEAEFRMVRPVEMTG
jgi:hypothetical protein